MSAFIEDNKNAWALLAKDHYLHFKKDFENDNYQFNSIVLNELGNIKGKSILHLQCNTGADSIYLARMGAHVTGVDLVPENIHYAKKLAEDLNVKNVDFIESDIMKLMDNHSGKYDIVFTSDGAIGWLPDLSKWGQTISYFLKDNGFFYGHDSHPFYLMFDERVLAKGKTIIKYPYFNRSKDESSHIGGYASKPKKGTNHYWMYSVGDLINALSQANLFIEYFNEHDRCANGMGGNVLDDNMLSYYTFLEKKAPMSFSIKAMKR